MNGDAKLQELAQRLGTRAADRIDADRTAQAVLIRLREKPRRTLATWVWMQPGWLKIAAAALLLFGAGFVVRGVLDQPAATSAVVAPLDEELRDLTAEQLREAMGSLEQPLSGDEAGLWEASLEGLNPDDLRALLRALEA
jgi:hypothetical protein